MSESLVQHPDGAQGMRGRKEGILFRDGKELMMSLELFASPAISWGVCDDLH